MAKAQSDPPASADHLGRKAPLAHPASPDQLARRVTPARHRQFASSPVRIAFAAETTKSWPILFAQVVRSTERSARRLERPQPVYLYVGELGQCIAPAALVTERRYGIKKCPGWVWGLPGHGWWHRMRW